MGKFAERDRLGKKKGFVVEGEERAVVGGSYGSFLVMEQQDSGAVVMVSEP